jgi:hypothetical protein
MFFAIEPYTFNKDYAVLTDKTKNNVIENSWFHRLMYEHDAFTMNGVAVDFSLAINRTETSYDKLKHCFSLIEDNNQAIVNELIRIEREILEIASFFEGKTPIHHIENQTKQGFIKLFNGTSRSYKTYAQPPPATQFVTHHTLKTYHMKQRPLNFSQTQEFILKISGIWYNDTSYGITYKFEKVSKQVC